MTGEDTEKVRPLISKKLGKMLDLVMHLNVRIPAMPFSPLKTGMAMAILVVLVVLVALALDPQTPEVPEQKHMM